MKVHPDGRKKKHHAKSRHGCITCKKRHLKCDETRPTCQRCVKDFGSCEGYQDPKTWLFEPQQPEQDAKAVGGSSPSSTNSSSAGQQSSSISDRGLESSSQTSCSPGPEYNRQKRWAPKSKSGCLTCKKRRVKCDEIRPFCGRCSSAQRKCEYASPLQESQQGGSTPLTVTKHKTECVNDVNLTNPFVYINDSPYKTVNEHRAFVHWQNRTDSCTFISRDFGQLNILGIDIPQGAWSYDCLKHGLLSAALVTASLEKLSVGTVSERQAIMEAVRQSSLAINSIFREKPPAEVTILVAFIFWFMEAWIGAWDRAVMHLASAARMCQQAFPRGEVSEAVAWYVDVCDVGVPQALRTPEILSLVQNLEDGSDQKLHLRLLWGIRETVAGLALVQNARLKVRKMRPNDWNEINTILAAHQEQMEFLCDRWERSAKHLSTQLGTEQELPPRPAIPMYSRAMEMIDHFLVDDKRYDALILTMRLKMIQRALPLFIAGSNMELRRDAAQCVHIKLEEPALENPVSVEIEQVAS